MPINKLTTLLDLSRQSKIISGETATFDGKIQVGIPFSGYPSGVDISTSVSLGVVSSETAVFSGNTGTTVFDVSNPSSPNYNIIFSGLTGTTWTNPIFSAYTSGLTLPITPLSAETQTVGPFWVLTQTGKTGDYVIGIQYTGFSITYSFDAISQFGTGFTYSGLTTATQQNFSAGTLDYKGPLDYISSKEDASINGRLTTDRITITNGASASTIGYVLTQTGINGEGEWQAVTGGSSTNIYNSDGVLSSGRVVDMNGNFLYFSGGSSNILFGFIGSGEKHLQWIDAALNWDLYNENITNNLKLDRYSSVGGYLDTPLFISFSGGNVGIKNMNPTTDLDVSGKTKTINFQMTSGATNGYVLTSDASGNASWQPSSGGSGTFTGGTVSGFTNFIGGLESEDFNGNLGSTNTFYVSGNSGLFNQIRLETLFAPTQSSYLSVGRGVSQLVSESGTTTSSFRVESDNLRLSRNTTGGEQTISFGLSATQMLVSDTLNSKGLEYLADYSSNYTNRSLVDKEYVDNQVGGVPAATTATTTTINFTGQTIYYDAGTPATGNISEDLTGAKLGLIQKIYHNDSSEPTYPAGWVLMGDAIYFTSTLNIIYAEWAGGTRVEYWYVQEQ
jgi:hypothetical protein